MPSNSFALPNPPFKPGGYHKKTGEPTKQKERAGYGEAEQLLFRYGVAANAADEPDTDLARKIADRVTTEGSQAPSMRMLVVLNASVDDLANGVKLGSDWIVNTREAIMDKETDLFHARAMDLYQRYDPGICGGYACDRQASKRKNIGSVVLQS
jgi:hypothetical protein